MGATTARTGPSASSAARNGWSSRTGECRNRPPSRSRITVMRRADLERSVLEAVLGDPQVRRQLAQAVRSCARGLDEDLRVRVRVRRGPRTPAPRPRRPTVPVTSGATSMRPSAIAAERLHELARRVAEHELHAELLVDRRSSGGWCRRSMQTPATTMRVPRGASRMSSCSMPGTPTHSKSTRRRADRPPRATRSHQPAASRGIDDDVRAHRPRQRAARGREVGGDDGLDAAQRQRRDHRQPDRTAADDQRRVVRLEARLLDRVPAHGHRLGERGVLGGEPVGHRQRERRRQHHAARRSRRGRRSSSRSPCDRHAAEQERHRAPRARRASRCRWCPGP